MRLSYLPYDLVVLHEGQAQTERKRLRRACGWDPEKHPPAVTQRDPGAAGPGECGVRGGHKLVCFGCSIKLCYELCRYTFNCDGFLEALGQPSEASCMLTCDRPELACYAESETERDQSSDYQVLSARGCDEVYQRQSRQCQAGVGDLGDVRRSASI